MIDLVKQCGGDSIFRIVYSREPITKIRPIDVEQRINAKPAGLWYSCGTSWYEFAEGAGWSGDYEATNRLMLKKNCNVLHLKTKNQVIAFDEEFGMFAPNSRSEMWAIDWKSVALNYNGIEICPYQYELHLGGRISDWYNPWDVASGCIWNEAIIQSITPF
jgi:hypothetical protein